MYVYMYMCAMSLYSLLAIMLILIWRSLYKINVIMYNRKINALSNTGMLHELGLLRIGGGGFCCFSV